MTSAYLPFSEAYRPYFLADVQGQEEAKRAVRSWFRTERVPNAILISGERSAGKTSMARVIGRTMLCLDRAEKSVDPCGKCRSCVAFDKDNHQDWLEVDAATDRGIDAMRELTSKIRLMPLMGKKKILLLDEAHQITTAGWNAWLKTLEKPPDHVTIIVATSEPTKVIETIKSRCVKVPLPPTPLDVCVRILERVAKDKGLAKNGITKEHLTKVARCSRASPRDSLHALDQVYTMLLDAQETGESLDTAAVNSLISQVATTPVETAAGGIIKGVLEGKPGGAMKRCEDYRAESDFLLTKLTEFMRQAMMFSVNQKLMDPFYASVISEELTIFQYEEARFVVMDAYDVFNRLRIDCSTHAVPVAEVLDGAVARAGLICQKFLKKMKLSNGQVVQASPPRTPKPAPPPVEEPKEAAADDDDQGDAEPPQRTKNKPSTPTARLPQ